MTKASAQTLPSAKQTARHRLILRDSLTFLSLTVVAIVLGGITTFLFRSFEAHRADLAIRWAQRGRDALQQGRSTAAVVALRTSLSYRPDDRATQLVLAQALAASGHAAEAENYFLNLWQAQPGDGVINLQLARLERSRGEAQAAIDYYRAAVFGTWDGDALVRRRDIRLELSKYLIERGQFEAAQVELLVTAGNNGDAATQLTIGQELEEAHDPKDAMSTYTHAAQGEKGGDTAEAKAGELCYRMGDYACAAERLEKALSYAGWSTEQKSRMTTMQHDARTLQELSFSRDLALPERTAHLLHDARLAQDRLKACVAESAGAGTRPPGLLALQSRWKSLDQPKNRNAVRRDEDLQDQYAALLFETETTVTQACGAPTGDDELLVHLQTQPMTHFGAQ